MSDVGGRRSEVGGRRSEDREKHFTGRKVDINFPPAIWKKEVWIAGTLGGRRGKREKTCRLSIGRLVVV